MAFLQTSQYFHSCLYTQACLALIMLFQSILAHSQESNPP